MQTESGKESPPKKKTSGEFVEEQKALDIGEWTYTTYQQSVENGVQMLKARFQNKGGNRNYKVNQ